MLIGINGSAQTTYTTNGSSTNWSTSTAWTPNGVPVIGGWPYDNVVINKSVTYTGSISNTSTSSITINNGGALTVTGNFTNGNWGTPSLKIKSGGTLTVGGIFNVNGSDTLSNAGTMNLNSFSLDGGAGSNILNIGTINVTNNMTFNVSRTLTSTAGNINVGGTMTVGPASSIMSITNTPISVTGSLVISGSGSFTDIGPTLTVGANLNNTGSVNTTIGAIVTVSGNATNTGSSILTFNNTTTVSGNLTETGATHIIANSRLAVSGTIDLSGSSYINGTGTVSWGTFTTDNSGSHIICVDGTKFDTDAGSAPAIPSPISKKINLNIACTNGLPVHMLYVNINDNTLEWATASEINNDRFIIQQYLDNKHWTEYGTVNGNGNSNRIITYQYVLEEGYYYRLLQIDYDGVITYFDTVHTSSKKSDSVLIGIYDIYGQKINSDCSGIQILLYSDGKIIKTFK